MKTIVLLVIILLFAGSTDAQSINKQSSAHPNLSGTWILDIVKSLGSSAGKKVSDYVVTIEHHDPRIDVHWSYVENGRPNRYTETLFTDRRKEENLDLSGAASGDGSGKLTITSKSFWKGRTIVREYTFGRAQSNAIYLPDQQKYTLSDDGNTLIITTVFQPTARRSETADATFRQNGYRSVERTLILRKR